AKQLLEADGLGAQTDATWWQTAPLYFERGAKGPDAPVERGRNVYLVREGRGGRVSLAVRSGKYGDVTNLESTGSGFLSPGAPHFPPYIATFRTFPCACRAVYLHFSSRST